MTPEELDRLVKMTPEAVVEAAVGKWVEMGDTDLCEEAGEEGHGSPMTCSGCARLTVWNLLPILLAPEVAKREAAEKELFDFKDDVLKHTGDPLAASLAYEAGMRDEKAESWELIDKMSAAKLAAEAERDRLREALEDIAALPLPRAEMDGTRKVGDPLAFGYNYQHIARAALSGRDTDK